MRIFLRVVASIVALAVVFTALMVLQAALTGALAALWRSGAFGIATLLGWLLILIVGPVGAVQLWRLRRVGLWATALLCGFALSYYVLGTLLLGGPKIPSTPIAEAVVCNAVVLALLLSPPARRVCS